MFSTCRRFAELGDDELSEILTFARKAWGNDSSAVTASQVRAMRDELALRAARAKDAMTPRLADLLDQPEAEKLIYGARLMMETRDLLPKNVGDVLELLLLSHERGNGGQGLAVFRPDEPLSDGGASGGPRHQHRGPPERLFPALRGGFEAAGRVQGNAGDGCFHGLDEGRCLGGRQDRRSRHGQDRQDDQA